MFKIIDNFLPKNEFNKIQKILMSDYFPWYFNDYVTSIDDKNEEYYFTHVFFNSLKLKGVNSDFFNDLNFLINKMNIKNIIRVKANFYHKNDKLIVHEKHTDNVSDTGAIFSINTNNGGTILYENETPVFVNSVENRMLFFNPNVLHSSTNCTNSKSRININFNYE